jgi:hypothetical protein
MRVRAKSMKDERKKNRGEDCLITSTTSVGIGRSRATCVRIVKTTTKNAGHGSHPIQPVLPATRRSADT